MAETADDAPATPRRPVVPIDMTAADPARFIDVHLESDGQARFPWNGFRTGSAWVPLHAPIVDHPLMPRFVWERTPGSRRFELQVDDSCDRETFRECDFPSPEVDLTTVEWSLQLEEPLPVSTEVPVGTRYYWRVRPCEEERCTGWSEVRYLDVGRPPDDYDGDGYSDLVVWIDGAPHSHDVNPMARVEIWRGGPGGLSRERLLALQSPSDREMLPDLVSDLGDVNGDGFDDLFVPFREPDGSGGYAAGRGSVWYGGPDGFGTPVEIPPLEGDLIDDPGIHRLTLSAGDLDGDGYDDAYAWLGRRVFYGSSDGLVDVHSDDRIAWGVVEAGPADVDADGYVDLVHPTGTHEEPEILIRFGGREREMGRLGRVAVTTSTSIWSRGYHVRAWPLEDTDRDGFVEIVISANNRLFMLEGPLFDGQVVDYDDIFLGRLIYSRSGPLRSGDTNGDGHAELTVPRVDETGSAVTVLDGPVSSDAPIQANARVIDPPGAFAFPSALRDYDADGYDDQVWPAHLGDGDHRLLLFSGGPRGLSWSPSAEIYRYPAGSLPTRSVLAVPETKIMAF